MVDLFYVVESIDYLEERTADKMSKRRGTAVPIEIYLAEEKRV